MLEDEDTQTSERCNPDIVSDCDLGSLLADNAESKDEHEAFLNKGEMEIGESAPASVLLKERQDGKGKQGLSKILEAAGIEGQVSMANMKKKRILPGQSENPAPKNETLTEYASSRCSKLVANLPPGPLKQRAEDHKLDAKEEVRSILENATHKFNESEDLIICSKILSRCKYEYPWDDIAKILGISKAECIQRWRTMHNLQAYKRTILKGLQVVFKDYTDFDVDFEDMAERLTKDNNCGRIGELEDEELESGNENEPTSSQAKQNAEPMIEEEASKILVEEI